MTVGNQPSYQPGWLERVLAEVGQGLSSSQGQPFFPALVEHLARAVGTRHAAVCRVTEGEDEASPATVSFVARWSEEGGVETDGVRPLAGTPCALVLGRELRCYREKVCEEFPDDALLAHLGVESYAAAPLFHSDGRTLGILTVLDTKPLEHPEQVCALLGLLAKLAAAELERADANASIQASERLHEAVLQGAPFGVYEYRLEPDDRLILTGINAAALESAAIPVEHLIGLTVEEAFPFLQDTVLPETYRSVARGDGSWRHPNFELAIGEAGVTLFLELYAFSTTPGTVAVMFNDITERSESERVVRESEALLQAFLDNAPFGACFFEVQPGADGSDLVLVGANRAAGQITGIDVAALVGKEVTAALPPLLQTELPRVYAEIAAGARGPHHDPSFPFDGLGLTGVFDVHAFQVRPGKVAALFRDVTSRARAEEAERSAERLEATATLAGGIAHELNNLMGGVLSGVTLLRRGRPGSRPYDDTLGQVASAAGRASELAQQLLAYARGGKYETVQLDLNEAVLEVVRRYRVALPETVALHSDLDSSLSPVAADRPQILLLFRCLLSNALEAVDPDAGLVVVRTREELLRDESAARLEVDAGAYAVITVADNGPGVRSDVQDRVFEPFFSTRAQGRGMGLAAAFGIARNHGGAIEVAQTHVAPLDSERPAATPPPTRGVPRPGTPTPRSPGSDHGPCPPLEACGGGVFAVYLPLQESHASFSISRPVNGRSNSAASIQAPGMLEGLGSLALGVAHDFNNLLALALNELESLRRASAVQPGEDRLRVVHETMLKCRALTQRLLQLGRGGTVPRRSISLNQIAAEVAELLAGALGASIQLDLVLAPDLAPVLGAPSLLENALLNLCFNARDAMPEGGRLRLETGFDEGPAEVWVRVTDTGVGMTDEVLRRSREPLFTTKSDQGTGLGLAMVDSVARTHGGRLEVLSTPGEGTRITITLPATDEPEATIQGQGRTVLLIDDSEHIARSTGQLLELEGFSVESVGSGEDALDRFEGQPYDLVILDVVLPGISGQDVFARIRELRPEQPVVICSGYGRQDRVRDLVGQGAVFLPKPFLLEELLERINEAVNPS